MPDVDLGTLAGSLVTSTSAPTLEASTDMGGHGPETSTAAGVRFRAYGNLTVTSAPAIPPPNADVWVQRVSVTMPTPTLDEGRPV